jgi:hypothetical protein
MKHNKFILSALALLLGAFLVACDTTESDDTDNSDIPEDPQGVVVPEPTINNVQPVGAFSASGDNPSRIVVNLTGVVDPSTGDPIALTWLDNFWLEEDGVVKGTLVNQVSSGGSSLAADVVFLVDNSGSMGEEADTIASSIVEFAQTLQNSGLNVQFGCVGYNGNVSGAINLTNAAGLEEFLNHPYYSYGTSRTAHFAGPDSAALADSAWYSFGGPYGENGVVGVLYSDKFFNWRGGAQRVYINFTDEPTQPGGDERWTTANMCQTIGGIATVHTVYSADTTYSTWDEYNERPWAMSECTGGTVKFVSYDASDLDLTTLPVTGALTNSYKVEFITGNPNAAHTVTMTIKTPTADGKRVYQNITY